MQVQVRVLECNNIVHTVLQDSTPWLNHGVLSFRGHTFCPRKVFWGFIVGFHIIIVCWYYRMVWKGFDSHAEVGILTADQREPDRTSQDQSIDCTKVRIHPFSGSFHITSIQLYIHEVSTILQESLLVVPAELTGSGCSALSLALRLTCRCCIRVVKLLVHVLVQTNVNEIVIFT